MLNLFCFISFLNCFFLVINKNFFFFYKFLCNVRSLLSNTTLNTLFVKKVLFRSGISKCLLKSYFF